LLKQAANGERKGSWYYGDDFRLSGDQSRMYTFNVNGTVVNATLANSSDHVNAWQVEPHGDSWLAYTDGDEAVIRPFLPDREAQGVASDRQLRSPMSGSVIHIAKNDGALVEAGDSLFIIEAMKMEHTVKAMSSGTLSINQISVGDQVSDDQLLATIEEL
ncbi:MAG: biotin/lipoyl-binding protein, partial [Gammaproteobacteria bacterium]|nr:biotin/lipoyl-binding protein [Gammaproteobacteria bacterium]